MRVKIKKPCHIDYIKRDAGTVLDVGNDLGARLCAAGYADIVRAQRVETAASKVVSEKGKVITVTRKQPTEEEA